MINFKTQLWKLCKADTLNHSVLNKTKLADLEKLAYNPDLDHLQKS